ncbi:MULTISPECIES: hypothetical protein [Priestia]|uniref:hypothetical protein n=1 Tax=Priestia TaxID=2800373 RepID=UPI0025B054B5|nr:hypothetical protein [Priestia megaterium]MDN3233220.1 hypothetical protein [Priestia megaterium]
MPINIQPILISMDLILQDVLKPNFVTPQYPAAFREIAIPVPTPPGVTNLPAFIYFDLDNQFTLTQEQDIKDAISLVLFNWFHHLSQKWNDGANNGISNLAACNNVYAIRNLQPSWYIGPRIPNGLVATNVAMDQFTRLIRDNGLRLAPKAKIFAGSLDNDSLTLALTALNRNKVPLSFIVDLSKVGNIGIDAGSIMHAWLHRAGFYAPNTTSYFITECSMCVMRGYELKNLFLPDSAFYKFFSQ